MRRTALPLVLASLAFIVAPAAAQDGPRPSQHGAVSQTVNETVITLEYDRPVARGRELFGDNGIVVRDALWTPGANRATWIDFSTPVTVEGESLPAGRYGIWLVPKGSDPWDVTLVREWDTSHTYFPYGSEALSVKVAPVAGSHMETLAFYFPVVGPYETELRMHWGEVVLPLLVEVGR